MYTLQDNSYHGSGEATGTTTDGSEVEGTNGCYEALQGVCTSIANTDRINLPLDHGSPIDFSLLDCEVLADHHTIPAKQFNKARNI